MGLTLLHPAARGKWFSAARNRSVADDPTSGRPPSAGEPGSEGPMDVGCVGYPAGQPAGGCSARARRASVRTAFEVEIVTTC
jgi:hypothetical protein